MLGPLKDPQLPAGLGVIALGTTGRLPLWPRPVYTTLELAALVACLVYYARTCRRQPDTGLVLALVPLVFAWRAFFVYVVAPLPLLRLRPLLAGLGARTAHRPAATEAAEGQRGEGARRAWTRIGDAGAHPGLPRHRAPAHLPRPGRADYPRRHRQGRGA